MIRQFIAVYLLVTVILQLSASAQTDKAKHAGFGFAITLIVGATSSKPKVGFSTAVATAAAKELYDSRSRRHVGSWGDFLTTVAGAGVGYVITRKLMKSKRTQSSNSGVSSEAQPDPSDVLRLEHSRQSH